MPLKKNWTHKRKNPETKPGSLIFNGEVEPEPSVSQIGIVIVGIGWSIMWKLTLWTNIGNVVSS